MKDRKTTTIQFRATTREKELLKEIAKLSGCPVSALIRNFINNKPVVARPDKSNIKFLEAVSGIGNDYNQMVQLMESGKLPVSHDVRLLYRSIQKLLTSLEQKR